MGHIEHSVDNIERIGQHQNGTGRFEYPLEENPVVQIMQIVFLDKELYQLVGCYKGQNKTGNGQYHRFRKLPYEGKYPGVPCEGTEKVDSTAYV